MDAAPNDPCRYSAFISYSHADLRFAERLQDDLEQYRLPGKLRGEAGRGRLLPVYRDISDLNAAPDLTDAIKAGIAASRFLIVVCSPASAKSEWVGREIDHFRAVQGDDRILAVLIGGSEAESIHPRLRVRSDGSVIHPLAADFRPSAGSDRLAFLKLVSRLFGVELDDLVHRDERRRRRRLVAIGAAAIALSAVVGAILLLMFQARGQANTQRQASARAMEFQLDQMRAQIRAGGTLSMSAALNQGVELYFEGIPESSGDPGLQIKRAELLQAKADDEVRRGNYTAAMADARKAWGITEGLLERGAAEPEVIFAHAQSAYWIGFVAWRLGDTPLAARAFGRYDQLADSLLKLASDNPDWLLEKGYAQSNLGMIALREARDWARAQDYFQRSRSAFERVAKLRPDDDALPYEIADADAWLADAARLNGDLDLAARYREDQRRLLDRLIAGDGANRLYRVDLVGNLLGRARIAHARGETASAFALLDEADRRAASLIAADRDDRSLAQVGRVLRIFRAYFALTAASGTPGLAGIEPLGSCRGDWDDGRTPGELGIFCSLTEAKRALLAGDRAKTRAILGEPGVTAALANRALTPRWMLDPQRDARELRLALGNGGRD